jgi:hypothetical protein
MNLRSTVLALCAIAVGVAWWIYHGKMLQESKAASTLHLAEVMCETGTLSRIIDAYPQAQMSESELGHQTLGEGLARLQTYRAALPAIVGPLVPQLQSDSKSWAYIGDLAKRVHNGLRLGSDDKLSREVSGFTKQVAKSMQSMCPSEFQNPTTEKFAEFGIGSVVGELGREGD